VSTPALLSFAALFPACASSTRSAGGAEPYPLDTCLVTENRLGSMGDPVTIVYEGREVKFCCAPCVDEFNKAPQKFMARLPKQES